jgi:hypothetical protein
VIVSISSDVPFIVRSLATHSPVMFVGKIAAKDERLQLLRPSIVLAIVSFGGGDPLR